MSDNGTSHFTGATESRERSGWKGEFYDDCQKTLRDAADVTWRDRPRSVQTRAAATGKALSPTVDNRVRRTRGCGRASKIRVDSRQTAKTNLLIEYILWRWFRLWNYIFSFVVLTVFSAFLCHTNWNTNWHKLASVHLTYIFVIRFAHSLSYIYKKNPFTAWRVEWTNRMQSTVISSSHHRRNNGEKVEGDHVRLHCTRMLPTHPSPPHSLSLPFAASSHIFWPKTQNRFNFIDVRRLHVSCSK